MARPLRLGVALVAAIGVTAYAGFVSSTTLGAATITEFSSGFSGATFEVTPGPDGNIWFTEAVANRIGRITPGGTVTEFSSGISTNSEPLGITTGPDGNLWFTEELANRIGRITLSGAVTEFPITGQSRPADITTGADGALWFTEVSGAIGRITTSGQITQFTTGITPSSQPLGITAGPDGNIWFTNSQGGGVGRITPSGTVTEFPTGGGTLRGIATGPDGNLWFTDNSTQNRVGRITPSGVVTSFGGLSSFSSLITAGPDGNLWFTERNADIVASISTSGTVTEYKAGITTGAGPFGITVGADGDLWFGENNASRIGRAVLGALPPPVFAKAFNVTTKSGKVLVELPAANRFVPLSAAEQVPIGTIVDVTHGVVQLCSASPSSQVGCSIFYGGQFKITQQGKVTVLVLVGRNFALCPQGAGRGATVAAHKVGLHASIRKLWADGKGQFRTQGRFASAGVRGTKWLTDDRCDGTLVLVAQGAVLVRDLTRHRVFTLKAPSSYVAPAKR